jgi:phosphoribosylformylglycinamidine (FGAM) synthase-like amidotransferase family enzyme
LNVRKQSELNVGLNPDDDEETIGICNHFNLCIEKKLLPYELINQNDKSYTLNFNGKEKYKKIDSLSSPMLPEAEDVIKYTQNWVKKMIEPLNQNQISCGRFRTLILRLMQVKC